VVEIGNLESTGIAMLSSGDTTGGSEGVYRLTQSNREEYARKHGYYFAHYQCVDPGDGSCNSPYFLRYFAIIDLLSKGAEWVFYMDTDTVITSFSMRIETAISKYSSASTGLIIASDAWASHAGSAVVVNSGVMLVRGNEAGCGLMNNVTLLIEQHQRGALDGDTWSNGDPKFLKYFFFSSSSSPCPTLV
jgi:hypothetical protein